MNSNFRFEMNNVWDEQKERKDIAIIGLDIKCPGADNPQEYWNNIIAGKDCTGQVPESRKQDILKFLEYSPRSMEEPQFEEGGYLEQIDKFDYKFFGVTKKDACYMDPCQRIFLETSMNALTDAGYGNSRLKGSKTGIFVGYNGREDYLNLILRSEAEPSIVANVGNMRSLIAGRISYYLDLHGPSLVVDTSCSSSLTAVHLACRSLRDGECDMAVAGGVELNLLPLKTADKMGIESENGKTMSFDNESKGTVFGEGSAAVILKPLSKAEQDSDYIYAVIKGSAVNQDGSSVGITAPNKEAQTAVIKTAWEDAVINPEQIGYIEAHGTGTVLGDPIEIDGLNQVFREYTSKNQICGVSTVKSNIGHLDGVSGIAGLIKAVFALKNQQIPPNLFFNNPNRKISFSDSAVYINDRLRHWPLAGDRRLCGVSSFGLSGTNCHIVLEEAPKPLVHAQYANKGELIFPMSAKSSQSLQKIIEQQYNYLRDHTDSIGDLAFTLATKREHYEYRFVVIASSKQELLLKLSKYLQKELATSKEEGIFYGYSREIRLMDQENVYGNPAETAEAYVGGMDMNWNELMADQGRTSILHLPPYPYEKQRCFIDIVKEKSAPAREEFLHPLIEKLLVSSADQDIYVSYFTVEGYWIFYEHKFMGKYFPPGTSFIEMANAVSQHYYPGCNTEIRDFLYISPLEVKEDEVKEVHIIVKKERDCLSFKIASKRIQEETDNIIWDTHVEGKIYNIGEEHNTSIINIKEKIKDFTYVDNMADVSEERKGIEQVIQLGGRWTEVKRDFMILNQEVMLRIELPEKYYEDLSLYYLHPSLLDAAVNAVTQATGYGFYLPLKQEKIRIYAPLPAEFYCYLKQRDEGNTNKETFSYDIILLSVDGRVLGEIERHIIKKVYQDKFNRDNFTPEECYYDIKYVEEELTIEGNQKSEDGRRFLVFNNNLAYGKDIIDEVRKSAASYMEVNQGERFRVSSDGITVGNDYESYEQLAEALSTERTDTVLYLMNLSETEDWNGMKLDGKISACCSSLFYFIKSIVRRKVFKKLNLVLISQFGEAVTGREKEIRPENSLLLGMSKAIVQEYPGFNCTYIDIDDETDIDRYMDEILNPSQKHRTSYYRENKRYAGEFIRLHTEALSENKSFLNEGVYVVTGGLGGVAYEIIASMADRADVRIAAIGRACLEEESTGQEKKLKRLQALKDRGTRIDYYSADISDEKAVHRIFEELRNKYGKINGIMHCAGITGDGYLFNKEDSVFQEVLLPKVSGTYVLDKVSEDDELEFFVLFSSVTSLSGAAGQADYTAANAYLDAYTHYRNKRGKKTLTINWTSWKNTGMVADYNVKEGGIFKMADTALAVAIFHDLIWRDTKRVIAGVLNYEFIKNQIEALPIRLSDEISSDIARYRKKAERSSGHRIKNQKSMTITGASEGADNITLQAVASIWGEVLLENEININDTFDQLGGDSILATELLKALELKFPELLDITDIFTYNTVSKMTEYITSKLKPKETVQSKKNSRTKERQMDQLLDALESGEISADEAKQYSL